jgi:hypothetical protein
VSSGRSGVAVSLDRFAGGLTVTAGTEPQILSFGHGREVRVCPGTTLSVTNSRSGQDFLFGMSTGAFEADYTLQNSADSVLTPDFRIMLEGPGEFHYAISTDARGNTCMRALPGNTASAMVSELIDDDKYEVKSGGQVVFHLGRLTAVETTVSGDCGCPPPSIPVCARGHQRCNGTEAPSDPPHLAQPDTATLSPVSISGGPETTPLKPPGPRKTQVQIDAPLVFRASDLPAVPAALPDPRSLPASNSSASALLPTTIQPSPSSPAEGNKQHHRFFARVKGFFAAIFR